MKNKIKPSAPIALIILIIVLAVMPLVFLFSPYLDWKMGIGGVCIFVLATIIFFLTDRSHSTIIYNDKSVQLKGFFGVRNKSYLWQDFEGYRLKQKADQASGFHDELQLILKNGKNIPISKVAYKEEYGQVYNMCDSKLKFIEHDKLKYGNTIAWIVRLAFLLSGIMALLVALKKLS